MAEAATRLRALSLGAGVQSTTLALMAAAGEIEPPDCAIFADTESEPAAVYRHLDWLERQLPFPVHHVSAGSLRAGILAGMNGTDPHMRVRPPFFTAGGGMLRRQCTVEHKIVPIERKVREILGVAKGRRVPPGVTVEQWLGISTDEASRMKPARLVYVTNRFPLIEAGMSRTDCLRWCAERGLPTPPKSACTFCPYRNDAQWAEMVANDPVSFADAVMIDRAIRPGVPGPARPQGEAWYLHRRLVPLDEVDFTGAAPRRVNHFVNECEGMCGV